jgi:hypothetical protein
MWSVVGRDKSALAIVLAHEMARDIACHHSELILSFVLGMVPGFWLNKRLKPFQHLQRWCMAMQRHEVAFNM